MFLNSLYVQWVCVFLSCTITMNVRVLFYTRKRSHNNFFVNKISPDRTVGRAQSLRLCVRTLLRALNRWNIQDLFTDPDFLEAFWNLMVVFRWGDFFPTAFWKFTIIKPHPNSFHTNFYNWVGVKFAIKIFYLKNTHVNMSKDLTFTAIIVFNLRTL